MQELISKVNLHKNRAKQALQEIKQWDKLDCTIFDDFDKIKTIDSFIYRFIKLQDLMGEKLFKYFLDELGEYKETMSLLDMLDKLEKFEIIENAKEWLSYRKLRNKLTHEYPDNEEDLLEGITVSMEVFNKIELVLKNIENKFNNIENRR